MMEDMSFSSSWLVQVYSKDMVGALNLVWDLHVALPPVDVEGLVAATSVCACRSCQSQMHVFSLLHLATMNTSAAHFVAFDR